MNFKIEFEWRFESSNDKIRYNGFCQRLTIEGGFDKILAGGDKYGSDNIRVQRQGVRRFGGIGGALRRESINEFARRAILEKMEDTEDVFAAREAMSELGDDPTTYKFEELKEKWLTE